MRTKTTEDIMFMRASHLCSLVVILALFGIGPVSAHEESPRGGEITYFEAESFGEFNPYQLEENRAPSDRLFALIYEGLLRYDYYEDKFVPILAKEWEKGGDGKSVTFSLRQGVEWHDGTKFTSADVLFTFNYAKSTIASERANHKFDAIRSVETPDEYTAVVHFKETQSEPLILFDSAWIIPGHLFTEAYLDRKSAEGKSLSKHPIGTGGYKFRKRTPTNTILEANENYWEDEAHILKVSMFIQPDPSTRSLKALGNEHSLVVDTPPGEVEKLEASGEFDLQPYESFTIHTFAYNCRKPVLSDPAVRRAMTQALDREQMLEMWFYGKGNVIAGPFTPYTPYFDRTLQPLAFDPEQAHRSLDEAGYRDVDGDGVRERPDGTPLRFKLLFPIEQTASETWQQNVAEDYVRYMAAIGIEIEKEPRVLDMFLQARSDHDFDIALTQWTFDNNYDITTLFDSAESEDGDNYVGYSNPEIDRLIGEFHISPDSDQRRDIMVKVQHILARECPYSFLYTVQKYAAIRLKYIYDSRIDPYYFFTYFPFWYISE